MSEQERRKRIRECYDAEKRRETGKISRSAAEYWSDVASDPPAGRGQTTEDLASRMFGAMFGNIERDGQLGADKAFHATMEKFSLTRKELAAILWGKDVFQKIQSVLVDSLGWGGAGAIPLRVGRLVGLGLLFVGTWLVLPR